MSKVLWGVVLSVHASEDASTSESSKRRVIVMTGIGPESPADEDDFQSMIRFMLYTNGVDVEALIAKEKGSGAV